MKNHLLTFIALLSFAVTGLAQAPKVFNYQAVVRDAEGQILPNQEVSFQIDLLQGDDSDMSIVCREIHNGTTNSMGLINLKIGRGLEFIPDFESIDWSIPTYMEVSLDVNGGDNYETLGMAQLLSVPYALYAERSGTGSDWDPTNELELPQNPDFGDMLYYNGSEWLPIPIGTPGEVLTVNNEGRPVWKEPNLIDASIPAFLPNGDTIYVFPGVTGGNSSMWADTWEFPFLPESELPYYETVAEALTDFNGKTNTQKIVEWFGDNEGSPYSAKICQDLEAYGYDDWYLPSAGELKVIYDQLGPSGSNEITMPSYSWWTSTRMDHSNGWLLTPSNVLESETAWFCEFGQRCVRKN